MPAPSSNRQTLLLLFVLALGARLLLLGLHVRAAGPEAPVFDPDSASYLVPADGLVRGWGYSFPLPDGRPYPETMRTPVYPAVIAAFKLAAGPKWLWALVLAQVALDAALVVPIAGIAGRIAGSRAGLLAAAFYSIAVAPTFYSHVVMAETLYSAIALGGAWLTYRALLAEGAATTAQLLRGASTGLLAGLATLTRPIGLYVFAAALIAGLACSIGAIPFQARWLDVFRTRRLVWFFVPGVAVFIALTGAWTARNGLATGYWSVASIDYSNLAFYRAAPAEAATRNVPVETVLEEYRARYELSEAPTWDEGPDGLAKGKQLRREAVRTILANKLGYARTAFKGCLVLLFNPCSTPLAVMLGKRGGRIVGAFFIAMLAVGWFVAAIGVARYPVLLSLVFVTAAYLAVASGYEAYARFRVPIEPYLAVCFGCGLGSLMASIGAGRQGKGLPRRSTEG